MDMVAVWLIDIVFLLLCWIVVCTVSQLYAFCNSQYLFTLFLVSRLDMVALSAYRASHVCGNICNRSCLVLQLDSAEPLRTVTSSVWIKLDDHTLHVGITAECVQPAHTPRLIPRGSSSVPPGTTSNIRSPPGIDPQTVQSVASRYTDWASRPTRQIQQCHSKLNNQSIIELDWGVKFPSRVKRHNFLYILFDVNANLPCEHGELI
jgi:hypothetical protein